MELVEVTYKEAVDAIARKSGMTFSEVTNAIRIGIVKLRKYRGFEGDFYVDKDQLDVVLAKIEPK